MIEPLVVEFEVAAPIDHAFAVWTERWVSWWPSGHTVSGDAESIVFEPHPGGRIFERGSDGTEHDWGTVVAWEPPNRVAYRWHLFFDPSEATDIEVTFRAISPGRTAVRLEQRGWERLGDAGAPRRTRTGHVWSEMSQRYAAACTSGAREPAPD